MPLYPFDSLLVLLLTTLFFGLLIELARFGDNPRPLKKVSRPGQRPLRPRTPNDCPYCRVAGVASAVAPARVVVPYAHRKSRRGRKKTIDTCGQACPNPDCDYRNITDPAVHALVGYGHHGLHDPIQDFYCQACRHTPALAGGAREFSARRHTALYRLKTPQARVAQVLHAVAEGLSAQAAARVFQLSETTIRSWITRAGQHSQSLHHRLMRALQLSHVQFDELRLKLRGAPETAWLWVACDARTKIIPAFTLGPRTQALAHQLVHEIAQRLAPGRLPTFCSDGLALYFFALTAHFGEWVQTVGERRREWIVAPCLLYAQVIKHYRRRRVAEVRHQVMVGKPEEYRRALCTQGFSGRIQTAFIERLNLTIRRSIAGLARSSWSMAHSLSQLALQFEWWRAVYHFAWPHSSLRQPLGSTPAQHARQRFRLKPPG